MSQAESTFITSLFWSARLLYCCGGDCCHPDRYGLRPTAHGLRKSHRINAKALREQEGTMRLCRKSTRNLLAKRESFGRLKPALPSMVAAIANISFGK